jgi:hypothetical protein
MTVQSSPKSSSMAVQSESKSSPYRWHRKEIYDGQLTTDDPLINGVFNFHNSSLITLELKELHFSFPLV